MFSRVLYEHWHDWVPYAAFASAGFVYGLMTLRGVMLRNDKTERIAQLPLED